MISYAAKFSSVDEMLFPLFVGKDLDWLCLRRVAIRALPLPSTSIVPRLRPITTLTSSITRLNRQPRSLLLLHKRFASEQAEQKEDSSIVSAIQSAPETLYNKASDAADSVSESVGEVAKAASSTLGAEAASPTNTIFVGNLFFNLRTEDLIKTFEAAGPVDSARIITDARGQSKGFGYVNFKDHATALKAVEMFNLQNLEGRQMNVQIQQPRSSLNRNEGPKNPPSKTLFIGNMPFDMSDRDLNNLFTNIKNIVDVRVAIDRRTGQPRGFAHADFVDEESAKQGMATLKNTEVAGRTLRLDFSASNRLAKPE
ncbi:hypothetical protein MMC07_001501 [Pseudocyphellaria aurata]|nr:hypothetical protein [Pseudocyphellaria aurata]